MKIEIKEASCGLTAQYKLARTLGWVAVKIRPHHFRCCGCTPGGER